MLIRRADAEDASALARIHVETWKHAYSGIIPSAYLSRLSIPGRTSHWTNILGNAGTPAFVLVAADDAGEVAGFLYAGPERLNNPQYRGEIYTLYVLPSRQQRGMGRALMEAAAERFSTSGISAFLLWVLGANKPGRKFYEKLGGEIIGHRTIEIGSGEFEDVAYGWPDAALPLRPSH